MLNELCEHEFWKFCYLKSHFNFVLSTGVPFWLISRNSVVVKEYRWQCFGPSLSILRLLVLVVGILCFLDPIVRRLCYVC
jgi:hypothetical protein